MGESVKMDTKGAEIKVINATDEYVYLLIYLRDVNRDWYEMRAKVPVEKFKPVGG